MLNPPMQYSRAGDALTKRSENCYLHAYPDPASPLGRKLQASGIWFKVLGGMPIPPSLLSALPGDPWTCGWGETGPDIHYGVTWTQGQADARLTVREDHIVAVINAFVIVPLTQGQFDATVDLCYNAGIGVLTQHDFGRLLNAGDYAGASAEFPKWVHAGGHVVDALVTRRKAERSEFDASQT